MGIGSTSYKPQLVLQVEHGHFVGVLWVYLPHVMLVGLYGEMGMCLWNSVVLLCWW